MPTQRISTNQVFNNAQGHISTAREREILSSEKASTMKEINRPSKDPTGWVVAGDLKNDLSIKETLAKNAGMASNVLTATDAILSRVQDIGQRAHELALQVAGTDQNSKASRQHVLMDVKALRGALLQTVNTQYGGRTLLGGLRTETPAFDSQGQYIGDDGKFNVEIEKGLVIPINISGDQAILGTGTPNGVNVITVFDTLIKGIEEDNSEIIQSALPGLARVTDQMSNFRSHIASAQGQIELSLDFFKISKESATEAISKIEDADVIKAFTDLARDQTVLRAALATSQKILSVAPGEFLLDR